MIILLLLAIISLTILLMLVRHLSTSITFLMFMTCFYFSLRSISNRRRADGSRLLSRRLTILRSSRLSSRFSDAIQVYLTQWFKLLFTIRHLGILLTVFLLLWNTFLIFCFLGEKLFRLVTDLLVLTEGIGQSLILLIAKLEAWFCLDLSQVTSLR